MVPIKYSRMRSTKLIINTFVLVSVEPIPEIVGIPIHLTLEQSNLDIVPTVIDEG